MSNTYTWTPIALIGYPQFEGETDVVTSVSYTVVADDGDGHTASYQSIEQTPLDPAAPFIPYPDLTPEIVIGWVQSSLGFSGVTSIYANLDGLIAAQTNPPESPENFPLPWGSVTGTVSNYVPPAPVAPEAPVAEAPVAEAPLIEPPAPDLSDPTH